ncbi:MAG: hypothetical protein AB7E70_09685 [Hyphomicrobiaceae bacterium]
MSEDWLLPIILEARENNWCVRIGCTTCGAHDFRAAVLRQLGPRGGLAGERHINNLGGQQIFDALSRCSEPAIDPVADDEACRWLLFFVWQRFGDEVCERDLYPKLKGTWAGRVLDRMRDHHKADQRRRALHEARQGVKKKDWAALGLED